MNFEPNNILSFMLWVVETFGQVGQFLVNFIFTPWYDNFGNTYSFATIILAPSVLGIIWTIQAVRAAATGQ